MEAIAYQSSLRPTTNFTKITISDNVDRTIAYDLTRAMLDDDNRHIELCFVLQRDYVVTDGGIALLMMFLSRAMRKNIEVMFTLIVDGVARVIVSPPDDYQVIRDILKPYTATADTHISPTGWTYTLQ